MFKIKYNYVMFQLNIHYSTLKINKYFHLQHLQLSEDIGKMVKLDISRESGLSRQRKNSNPNNPTANQFR